ncbi:integrase core domain-containing protein [Streptomyces sp. NPDC050549]|uniref:integrase core domain-containing protein n=1 Tax=Streptomyces sp. NPDC050549 TaxID=3155406 RepID=UPI003421576F
MAFLEHGTRRLHVTGVTRHPTGEWATQQARTFATDVGTGVESLRFVLRDRDTKYTASFDAVFEAEDVDVLLSGPRVPRMNAHCERVIGTVLREVLDQVLVLNEAHARRVLAEYQDHCNGHRPHRARGQRPPGAAGQPAPVPRPRRPKAPTHPSPRRHHQGVQIRRMPYGDDFPSPTGKVASS